VESSARPCCLPWSSIFNVSASICSFARPVFSTPMQECGECRIDHLRNSRKQAREPSSAILRPRYAGFRAAMLLALNPIQRKYCLHRAAHGGYRFLFSKSNHRAGHHDPGCTAGVPGGLRLAEEVGTAAADDGAAVLPLCCAQNTGGRHDIPCGSRGSPRAAPGGSGSHARHSRRISYLLWGIPWRMAAGQSDPCDVAEL